MTPSALVTAGAVLLLAGLGRTGWRAHRRERARRRLTRTELPCGSRHTGARFARQLEWPWLLSRLAAADVGVAPDAVVAGWLGGGALAVLAALGLAGPGLAVAAAGVAAIGPLAALRLLAGRRDARVEAALPLALEAMARTLRTAGSLRQAVGEAAAVTGGALGVDLAAIAARVDHGMPLIDAVDAWVERRPLVAVRLAAAALALGAETGGAQARALDGVAATIRDRLGAAAEVRAQATQARVSAAVIALAPIAFAGLATATDRRTATFLFRTPAGLVLLTVGLGLDALGALWMGHITKATS